MSTGVYVWGIVLVGLCASASLLLALEHIGGLSLPGCGEGSPCAEAAASVWGKVPYVGWPVSFLGVAYFLGLSVVWLTARPGVPVGIRHLVRGGALISLGFVVIMLVERQVCSYCVATHLGNFAFWIVVERAAGAAAGTARAFATIAAVFAISSGVLGSTEWRERKAVQAKAEEELADSTAAIISATSQRAAAAADTTEAVVAVAEPVAGLAGPASAALESDARVAEPAEPDVAGQPSAGSAGFTGRYRLGPEKAAIRVVMFSDYQCKECRRIESEVVRIFERRDDMSVSFKHYPMNSDCNRKVKRTRHPNACWAARAAETAGILNGNDGFWEMHFWLFEHRGSFTRAELRAALSEFGYDIAEFERIMPSDETLQ
ncbi:MAG: vitamin K epoxide reductase family protein, partial [Phycisphaerae bacterium]